MRYVFLLIGKRLIFKAVDLCVFLSGSIGIAGDNKAAELLIALFVLVVPISDVTERVLADLGTCFLTAW